MRLIDIVAQKEKDLEAGGPGSGRKPGFGFGRLFNPPSLEKGFTVRLGRGGKEASIVSLKDDTAVVRHDDGSQTTLKRTAPGLNQWQEEGTNRIITLKPTAGVGELPKSAKPAPRPWYLR